MKVYLEVFFTSLVNDAVIYSRSFRDISLEQSDPDELVHRELHAAFPDVQSLSACLLVHSTSWRHEKSGQLVITYLVYCDDFDFTCQSYCQVSLGEFKLALNPDPCYPRPVVIEELNVLSHGFRHLSFLLKSNPESMAALTRNPLTHHAFATIDSSLAGRLAFPVLAV